MSELRPYQRDLIARAQGAFGQGARAAGGTWRGKPLVSAESIATARAMRAGGALLREVAAHLGLSVTHTQRLIAGGA